MSLRFVLALLFVLPAASPWLAAPTAAAAPPPPPAADETADTLGFEAHGPGGRPGGWSGGPAETLHRDSTVVHAGRYAARIERGPGMSEGFSALSRKIPITFTGDTLELRGWLRTEGVAGGYAGLWLREDGSGGVVGFDNMGDRGLVGSRDWTPCRIVLPLDRRARSIVFGALLVGEGKAWVDDLELLVDGKPFTAAPRLQRVETAVDRDHEFDAGSKIEAATLSAVQVENLVLLGKVWGFLKHHHPRVTAAQVHWDYELFRILPPVLKARDRAAAAALLEKWVDGLGAPPACGPCAELPDSAQMLPRLEWIRDRARLGNDLTTRLQRIHRNRDADGDQHYVALVDGVGNPDFANEQSYPDRPYPDAGYRLLALYRFWNIVEYWFPYRDLIREDWDGVLAEFIPRLMDAGDQDAYRLTLIALIARVHDGHANLWGSLEARPPRGDCQLPVVIRFVEGQAVVAGYSNATLGPATGLQIGDAILALDGKPVEQLTAEWEPYYAASNRAAQLRDMARALTAGDCGPCRVTAERLDARLELTTDRVARKEVDALAGTRHDLPGETFRFLADDVAYLKLSSVAADSVADYVRRAAGAKCLVIDIRNYPRESVVFALGQHLVEQRTEFARFTRGDLTNPGAFLWTRPIALEPAEPRYAGSVVLLVDEVSQSHAEYTAMALRAAPRALVVGSTTAGADGNISYIPLPGGVRGAISGLGVFYPDRTPTQQVGIVPDLVVHPTIAGTRAGRDEVLEAAVRRALGRHIETPAR
jgi:hypothetical protein